MKQAAKVAQIAAIAYCLLSNHYHFLVRQDADQRAGLLPQRVFNSYGKAYNKRYGHSGTLFEGPYRVRLIVHRAHLHHLCRYIHANPVRHGLVRTLDEWPYSNYPEWVGERDGTLVDRDFIATAFGTAVQYRAYVNEYLVDKRHPPDVATLFALC